MTNSVLITIILLVFLVGVIAIGIHRLMFKKSIVFNIVAVMTIPFVFTASAALFVGAKGVIHFLWGAPCVVIILSIAYEIIARMIQKPMNEMVNTVDALSEGNLEVTFSEKFKKGSHELAKVMRRLAKLTESLKNVAVFANQVGKGELNAEYQLLSDADILGNSLLEMRTSLQKAEKEQSIRTKEEEQRNWGTAGLAKFAEILRRDNNDIEALSYNVISNMVKYLGINQGGIFVMNEAENEEDRVLEMKACYAFDRKKFVDKQIRPGEGLVGTCYIEGEPIYMTKIPDSYINITSGLGDANPGALLICPLKVNEKIYGVIELASFRPFKPHQLDFVQKVSESIAATISTVNINIRTNRLLAQTKLQAEEMANQEEELRQNMEEMQATQDEMRRRESDLQNVLEKSQEAEYAANQLQDMIFESFNICEFTSQGILTEINQSTIDFFKGFTKADFIGKSLADFFGEKETHSIMTEIGNGKRYENSFPIPTGAGITTLMHHKFFPILNKEKKMLRFLMLAYPEISN